MPLIQTPVEHPSVLVVGAGRPGTDDGRHFSTGLLQLTSSPVYSSPRVLAVLA